MMRHAIIQDGVVVQATYVREGDEETPALLGAIPCPDWVCPGDLYDAVTGTFTDVEPGAA